MLLTLQIVTLILVALAMAPSVAHAAELPGKLRLPKEAYFTVQQIYYPGFTIAGLAEGFSMVAALALVILTPRDSAAFGLALAALLLLLVMHAVFWLVTQPVNKIWLKDTQLGKAGSAFFSAGGDVKEPRAGDWTALRNRWEYSHVARAVLVTAAFALLVSAVAIV
jgi:Domain of unknown function (DUF1772)